MQNTMTAERKKLIAAIALGVLSVVALVYVFFGDSLFGSKPAARTPAATAQQKRTTTAPPATSTSAAVDTAEQYVEISEVVYQRTVPPQPAIGRNIFAFYVPPKPPVVTVTATPPPPPPIDASGVSPSSVFAGTGEFPLTVMGTNLTPEMRITFDNNELPTKFLSAQQVTATVPAALISVEGDRQVMLRSPDGKFSAVLRLTIARAPRPDYIYTSFVGDKRYKNDYAVLHAKPPSKESYSIRRGDVLGGRFMVVGMSSAEVALVDVNLHLRYNIPFEGPKGSGVNSAPGPVGGSVLMPDRRLPPGRMQTESIPGIPDSIPRYQPPSSQRDDDDDGKP